MEEERGLPPIYDHHHHHLQISFSTPHHQEMGFVQFEDHNPVLSFLVAPPPQPLDGGASKATTADNNGSLGFNHGELAMNNRPSWNNDQVEVVALSLSHPLSSLIVNLKSLSSFSFLLLFVDDCFVCKKLLFFKKKIFNFKYFCR